MQFKLSELKTALSRERGNKVTWNEIEQGTGIRRSTLIAMDQGAIRQIRPEYIDALARFFGVGLDALLALEDVNLPLSGLRKGTEQTGDEPVYTA